MIFDLFGFNDFDSVTTWFFLLDLLHAAYQSDLISEVGHEAKQAISARPKGRSIVDLM